MPEAVLDSDSMGLTRTRSSRGLTDMGGGLRWLVIGVREQRLENRDQTLGRTLVGGPPATFMPLLPWADLSAWCGLVSCFLSDPSASGTVRSSFLVCGDWTNP